MPGHCFNGPEGNGLGLLPLTANVAQAAKEFARKNVHQRVCFENGESSKLLTVRRFKV